MTATEHPHDDLFVALSADEGAAMARLRTRLAGDAQDAGILDVAYRTLDTAVGPLLLAATEQGLVRVAYDRQDHETVLAELVDKVSPRILHAPARLDLVAHQLEEYFAGTRQTFDVPLDFRLASGFRLGVLRHLIDIGYGQTESYTRVAAAAGSPRAVRAGGSACARNPLPVVVPCHRVVRANGSFGGTSVEPGPSTPSWSSREPPHEPHRSRRPGRPGAPRGRLTKSWVARPHIAVTHSVYGMERVSLPRCPTTGSRAPLRWETHDDRTRHRRHPRTRIRHCPGPRPDRKLRHHRRA